MHQTRPRFTHDHLLVETKSAIEAALRKSKPTYLAASYTDIDCVMSGLAVFTLKHQSLLQFDKIRNGDPVKVANLKRLFHVSDVPCDTQLRVRLDSISPDIIRPAFRRIFTLLQRGKELEHFQFMQNHYLISVDGTGVFSSKAVHCDNCCVKEHRDGSKTFYHQILSAAMVHPEQQVVIPFAPEPIMKTDGQKKNDCERNAAKRWVEAFRREHPHLPVIIVADGLSSNAPFIKILSDHKMKYILVAKENDHKYMFDWIEHADANTLEIRGKKGFLHRYRYVNNVPLNDSNEDVKVNVLQYWETNPKGKLTQWTWVTDIEINDKNVEQIMRGGRSRWKIENEVFNTLKNQGYEFEHNFGHGKKYLNQVFTNIMMLAFLIDQCLQKLNKRFQAALTKCGAKKILWHKMLNYFELAELPDMESLYHIIVHPPPIKVVSVL